MSFGNDDAQPFGALPGLSSRPPNAPNPISTLPGSFASSQHLLQTSNKHTPASNGSERDANLQSHLANAQAYESSLPGLSNSYAQSWTAQQSMDSFPKPTLYNIAHQFPDENPVQSYMDLSKDPLNTPTGLPQQEIADTSEELEEGELSDSDSEFEPDPLPDLPTVRVGSIARDSNATSAVNGHDRETHGQPLASAHETHTFSPAYLHEQRQAAKNFITYSGFTYQALAQEGFNTVMLQSLFNELGISTEPDAQLQIASSHNQSTKPLDGPATSNTSQPSKPANREEYLARLKALQKKAPTATISEKQAPGVSTSDPTAEPRTVNPASTEPVNPAVSVDKQPVNKAHFAIRIKGTTNENKARNMFQKADRGKIRRIERLGAELALYFDSMQDMRTALDHLPFHYKQVDKGKLYASELKMAQIESNPAEKTGSGVLAETKSSSGPASTSVSLENKSEEDAALLLRKEKLARLRAEALKSAKAAQAKKELAAARAGAWLENFSTETAPASSSGTPVLATATLKRPATSELGNSNPAPAVKRPFGQPRYEEEQDDCIIEASDDEVLSDADRPVAHSESRSVGSALTTPKATQSRDGLEAHELKIMEMRRKILELEQKNKAKANSGNSTPAPDAQMTTIAPASAPATPLPLAPDRSLTARDNTPIPAGASPLEWKKQRRSQIQSTLPAYNAKVASTANKLALLKQQMKELEESMQQEERERQQLLQELDNLGMDTDAMPDMPIEELKATRDDLNAQLEADTAQARDNNPQTHNTAETEHATNKSADSGSQVAERSAQSLTAQLSDNQSETSSVGADAADAMDISESESDTSDVYEPPEYSSAMVEASENEQGGFDNHATHGMNKPPGNLSTTLQNSSEDTSNEEASDDQSGSTSDVSVEPHATEPEQSGENMKNRDSVPVVVSSDSERDSIYGDAADDEGPEIERDSHVADGNDFNLSSTDDEGSARAATIQNVPETHHRPGSAMQIDSDAKSSSSGDASMEESESEDDYEPPEVSVPPEQPASHHEPPPDESSSESENSSSQGEREEIRTGEHDDEEDPYEPPEAGHDPVSAMFTIDETLHQQTTDQSLLAADEQTSRKSPAAGDSDESVRKMADFYKPYESPLKIFKSYRQHSDAQETVAAEYSSLTYSHSIDSNTPLCPFELAGGVCNDTTCNSQHFRSMLLPGPSI